MINETMNFNSQVTVKNANGNDIQVAFLSANLDTGSQNFNISMNVTNKDLVIANKKLVKAQFEEFMKSVTSRATALGFTILGT